MKKLINLTLLSCLAISSLAFAEEKQFDIKANCKKIAPYLKATAKTVAGLGSLTISLAAFSLEIANLVDDKSYNGYAQNQSKLLGTIGILSIFPTISSTYLLYSGLNDFYDLYKGKKVTFNENVEAIDPDGKRKIEKIKDKEVGPTVA